MEDKIKMIQEQNMDLQARLRYLQDTERGLKRKKKPNLKFTTVQNITPQRSEFEEVQSRIDPNLITQAKKRKEIENETKKERLEMEQCTFKPQVNQRSKAFMKDKHYVPLYKRKMPNKEVAPPPDKELEEFERIQEQIKKKQKKVKVDPKQFYEKQLEWERKKISKNNLKRLEKAIDSYKITKKPKVNSKKNKELLKQSENFLKRVNSNMLKSQKIKQGLVKQYSSHTFQPKVNKNDRIQSIVMQKLKELKKAQSDDENLHVENIKEEQYEEETNEEQQSEQRTGGDPLGHATVTDSSR